MKTYQLLTFLNDFKRNNFPLKEDYASFQKDEEQTLHARASCKEAKGQTEKYSLKEYLTQRRVAAASTPVNNTVWSEGCKFCDVSNTVLFDKDYKVFVHGKELDLVHSLLAARTTPDWSLLGYAEVLLESMNTLFKTSSEIDAWVHKKQFKLRRLSDTLLYNWNQQEPLSTTTYRYAVVLLGNRRREKAGFTPPTVPGMRSSSQTKSLEWPWHLWSQSITYQGDLSQARMHVQKQMGSQWSLSVEYAVHVWEDLLQEVLEENSEDVYFGGVIGVKGLKPLAGVRNEGMLTLKSRWKMEQKNDTVLMQGPRVLYEWLAGLPGPKIENGGQVAGDSVKVFETLRVLWPQDIPDLQEAVSVARELS